MKTSSILVLLVLSGILAAHAVPYVYTKNTHQEHQHRVDEVKYRSMERHVCDVGEYCTGTYTIEEDALELCDGSKPFCPDEEPKPKKYVCRPGDKECPNDLFEPSIIYHRRGHVHDVCDVPVDTVQTVCNPARNECDATLDMIPSVCRAAHGPCDIAERCEDKNDSMKVEVCNPARGVCDRDDLPEKVHHVEEQRAETLREMFRRWQREHSWFEFIVFMVSVFAWPLSVYLASFLPYFEWRFIKIYPEFIPWTIGTYIAMRLHPYTAVMAVAILSLSERISKTTDATAPVTTLRPENEEETTSAAVVTTQRRTRHQRRNTIAACDFEFTLKKEEKLK